MLKGVLTAVLTGLLPISAFAGDIALRRAESMGPGMNLSFLENYWNGTKDKHYSDFVKKEEYAAAEQRLKDIAAAGFTTVRIPINFSAWASMEKPYGWESEDLPRLADHMVEWALAAGLKVIVDLHHPELNENFPSAASDERMAALWSRIASRYKNTDPERVFFELRNEPKEIEPEVWRRQAELLISTVRKIAPKHTLIVGFHDWNSRDALVSSEPFEDDNIIYTFHYYHPFMFTHQGATWVAPGISDLRAIPFPGVSKLKLGIPEKAKGTWVEDQLKSYAGDANEAYIDAQIGEARHWADKNKVPIFLGEFGSLSTYARKEDRCRYVDIMYRVFGRYRVPSAWWEWFAGFNFLDESGRRPEPCMQEAVDKYKQKLLAPGKRSE